MKKNTHAPPLYSMPGNLCFLLKKAWQMDKGLFAATLTHVPIVVLIPLTGTYLSRLIVVLATVQAPVHRLIASVATLACALLLLHLLHHFLSARIEWRSFGNRFAYMDFCCEKIMDTDYENIESSDGQTKMQKALDGLYSLDSGAQQVFRQFTEICSNGIGLAVYTALIFQCSPWIVAALCSMTVGSYYLHKANQYWIHRNKDNWVPIDRRLKYIHTAAGDFKAAKDVRLYRAASWFNAIFLRYLAQRQHWTVKAQRRNFAIDAAAALITLVRDVLAYGILLIEVAMHGMTAAEFIFFFSLIGQYSAWMFGLVDAYNALQSTSLSFCDLREFLDTPDHFNRGPGNPLPEKACDIVMQNVSFRYKNCGHEALSNISLNIRAGEKIALVGLNGAGKTTLVKLLCGLYAPTAGSIQVAGAPIFSYNMYAYFTLLSVVFQDIHLLPVSIAKNIALCEEADIDRARLDEVLRLAGLYEKVQGLPQRENTLLLKSIYDHAIDLSGGELQKLALARALYKNGRLIVLDEPTAALDPVAEHALYQRYNELTKGSTSIFISHRLSSTRFCDRILFLEQGRIVEEGSHDALMEAGGRYAALFEMQSRYYKEGQS